MDKPTIIAEFGINHKNADGGFLPNIPDLIKELADKGADMIKFQHFYADELVREDMPASYSIPGKEITLQRDLTRRWETSIEKQVWLKELCNENNVQVGYN